MRVGYSSFRDVLVSPGSDRRRQHSISPPSPLLPSPVVCGRSIHPFPASGGHLSRRPSPPSSPPSSPPPSFFAVSSFSLWRALRSDSSGRDKVLMPSLKVTAPVPQPGSRGAADPSPCGYAPGAAGERGGWMGGWGGGGAGWGGGQLLPMQRRQHQR